jgi:hypothetical protein
VVCYDADTGKILWQDELQLMTLPERGEVGQPAGPVPEPTKAAKMQLLFERGLAWSRLSAMVTLGKDKKMDSDNMATRLPLIRHAHEIMTGWETAMTVDFPKEAAALQESLAGLKTYLNGDWEAVQKAKGGTYHAAPAFWRQVANICRTSLYNHWQGSISDVMASPVSDGEIVAVTLGFGQVAAYELATGKRLWAWRDPKLNPGSVSHCASPCLWKDLVLVPAAGKRQGKGALTAILGIDKRTGVVRWETLDNQVMHGGNSIWGNSHGNHMSPHLMRLPGGKSLLVHNSGNLIDPETGVSLGQLPKTAAGNDNKNDDWGSGFIASLNGTLFKGWGGDCKAPPINAWPLSLGADGKVVIAPGYACQGGSAHGPFALSDRLLVAGRSYCDPATGKNLKDMERERLGTSSIAGRYLLSAGGAGSQGGGMIVGTLVTRVWDISDPTAPKKVGENTLAIPGFTPDISAKHFPKAAELYPTANVSGGHGNYQGIGFNFAVDTSGLTAIGSRIYLHSPGMLICIGEK